MIPELVVYYLLTFVGLDSKEAKTMTCIAKHESHFRPAAMNLHNENGSIDAGLFQINTVWFDTIPECSIMRLDNPIDNVKCAKHVLDKQGLTAWVAYTKNQRECDDYRVEGLTE